MEVVRQTYIFLLLVHSSKLNPLDKEQQESDPKPPLPPPNLINPIFGYCQDKNCSLCPTKSTVKIGEFFTCFPQKDDSRASCQLIHWHSKNNQCLQDTEDDFK